MYNKYVCSYTYTFRFLFQTQSTHLRTKLTHTCCTNIFYSNTYSPSSISSLLLFYIRIFSPNTEVNTSWISKYFGNFIKYAKCLIPSFLFWLYASLLVLSPPSPPSAFIIFLLFLAFVFRSRFWIMFHLLETLGLTRDMCHNQNFPVETWVGYK